MRRVVVALGLVGHSVCLLGAGCGASSPRPGAEPEVDAIALDLVAALPESAQRCAVSRPARVPEAQRGLVSLVVQESGFAWERGLPFEVVATAEHVSLEGRNARVVLAHIDTPPEQARELIDRHSGFRIAWEGQCGDECDLAIRGRFRDEHTVELAYGAIPPGPRGAPRTCARLVLDHPDAVEISAGRERSTLLDDAFGRPLELQTVVRAADRGLRVTRRAEFADALDVEPYLRELLLGEHALGRVYADRVEPRVNGHRLALDASYRWDDLELAAADRERLRLAILEDEQAREPLPPEDVDVTNHVQLDEQLQLRREQLAVATGDPRVELARALAMLLDRARTVQPAEEPLAEERARLALRELDDPRAALDIAGEMIARATDGAPRFRVLRREAASHLSPSALADVLHEDGLAHGDAAHRAAVDIVALVEGGIEYHFAESAWLAAERFAADAPAPRAPVAGARFPRGTLLSSISVLAGLAHDDALAGVYVIARGEPRGDVLPGSTIPVVPLHDARGRPMHVGMTSLGDPGLGRELEDALFAAYAGPTELSIFVVPFTDEAETANPSLSLSLAVDVGPEAVVIERAGGAGAGVAWARVGAFIASPLATMSLREFPPPDLVYRLPSRDAVTRVVDVATRASGVRCEEPTPLLLQCSSTLAQPSDLVALLLEVARTELEPDIARLRASRPQ